MSLQHDGIKMGGYEDMLRQAWEANELHGVIIFVEDGQGVWLHTTTIRMWMHNGFGWQACQ